MMGHMKKYKCPRCLLTNEVINYGRRKKVLRYLCKRCNHHFSINPCFSPTKQILNDHLDGLSFRKLAIKYDVSPMKAWRICETSLKALPNNNQFTFNHCSQFGSVFEFDGKYFNVAEGNHDWVLLWGIDYFRHDIPVIYVAPSESYQSWSKFFFYFRIINHFPQLLLCDDNQNLKLAAKKNFPSVIIQTCTNHFKENIRRNLKVRSDPTYRDFTNRLQTIIGIKLSDEVMRQRLLTLVRNYHQDPLVISELINIERYWSELTAYRHIGKAPLTTNMIEGLNSHLEARLFSLRSFQSIHHAKLWLNGYVLKRRFTKHTDCKGKFRRLNGKSGVELTQKPGIDLPRLF
jgi:hypothetical protein